jgi:four helix bundle protein
VTDGAKACPEGKQSAGRRAQGAERRAKSAGRKAKEEKRKKMNVKFRFEDFEIWKDGIQITKSLLSVANDLEDKKLYRFAEQLRAAAMSITNNIAEGSGSFSDKEFSQFLNISRRSIFECVNILIILNDNQMITNEVLEVHKEKLDHLSRKITLFRKSIQ